MTQPASPGTAAECELNTMLLNIKTVVEGSDAEVRECIPNSERMRIRVLDRASGDVKFSKDLLR